MYKTNKETSITGGGFMFFFIKGGGFMFLIETNHVNPHKVQNQMKDSVQ